MAESEDIIDSITEPPQIDWNPDVTDLSTFQNGSGLPSVVKFNTPGAGASTLPLGLRIYADQPVLLYARTCKKHARARTIYHDKQGPYYEVGQTLDIPEDFDGWFEIVPPDFGRGQVFRTIGQLAECAGRKFFTRSTVMAIRIDDENEEPEMTSQAEPELENDKNEKQSFKERKLRAGSILTIKGSFAAKWQTTAKSGLIKKKNKEYTTVEVQYLKCIDATDGKEVLIPWSTRGRFNLIYENGAKDIRTIYRMKDILSSLHLPIKVRMIYGKAPVVPCIFTGMLNLKSQIKEDRLIASTALNKRNVLFEMPVNSECEIRTAADSEQYENRRTYIDANKLCKKYALSYASLIKLSPEIDTDQQMIQHIPTEKSKSRDESLRTLDLITNISLTDDEPRDYFMESSDTDSIQSAETMPLGMGQMMELKEIEIPRPQSISKA